MHHDLRFPRSRRFDTIHDIKIQRPYDPFSSVGFRRLDATYGIKTRSIRLISISNAPDASTRSTTSGFGPYDMFSSARFRRLDVIHDIKAIPHDPFPFPFPYSFIHGLLRFSAPRIYFHAYTFAVLHCSTPPMTVASYTNIPHTATSQQQ